MVMQIQKRDSDMILLHHHLLGIRCNHGMHLCKNFMIGDCICIGEESFEHANVLSEKINFSALGGPGVAIFGPDDLHPMC